MLKENSVCDLCGNDYYIELIIPDELWEKHIHKGNFIVMACPHCIVNRLGDDNKPYAFKLVDLGNSHPPEREALERFENIAGHMIPSPDGGWIRYAELVYKYPHLAEKQSKTEKK